MAGFLDALFSPAVIAAAVPSIVGAIGGGISKGEDAKIARDKLNFDKQQALAEDQYKMAALAQQLEIAKMNAASAGAGSGAALAAARITDARERLRMKQEAQQALLAARLRSLEMLKPEVINSAATSYSEGFDKGATRTQQGFQGLAQLLQQPFSQIGRPTFGG